MGETDLESAGRQTKHQMIARINKDFVPACRYGLRGLHGGQHVQLPSSTNSALGVEVPPLGQTACIDCIQEISIN